MPAGPADAAQPPFPDADLMYIVDLLPPDEQLRYQEVREFLQSRIRAASIDYWNREEFPFGLLAELGKYGLGGLQTDGTSKLFKGLMYVEVARADVSLSALVGIHNELIVGMIDELGSEEQKARWLPGLTAFTQLGAFALTEPEHGSDIAGGLETTARLEGGEWVINGAKRWIGAGTIADFALVWARDVADQQIKGFIVETDRPGYTATKIANKIGLRIMQNADIVLEEVRIPEANLLPGATDFSKANELLRDSRAWVGWQGAGIQLAAFDVARSYSLQRKPVRQGTGPLPARPAAARRDPGQRDRLAGPDGPAGQDPGRRQARDGPGRDGQSHHHAAGPGLGGDGPVPPGRQRDQQRLRDGQAVRRRRDPLHLRGQLRNQFSDRGAGRDGEVGLRLGSPAVRVLPGRAAPPGWTACVGWP